MPNMLMLPFSTNDLNAIVVGENFPSVVTVLPNVFLIAMVGYFSLLAGGSLWHLRVGLGLRKRAADIMNVVPRCSMMLISSRKLLVLQALMCIVSQAAILAIYFATSGFGFDLRGYTFAHPWVRPVALIISNYSIVIASHCFARYADTREKVLLFCTLLISGGLVFFGARASILAIYFSVLLCYLVKRRDKVSLLRLFGLAAAMILGALYLGSVRDGVASLPDFLGSLAFLLLYGSNFSDLRDFGWVYAGWNHVPWFGKTYLAAVIAFVPRVASEFRDTWGSGVAMDLTAGVDPTNHPGLRPGSFGEAYFNFGLLGVVVAGLILGLFARLADAEAKQALTAARPSIAKAFSFTMMGAVAGCFSVSASVSALYVLLGVYFITWLCLRVEHLIRPPKIFSVGST
ncbi:oligosaccharide repeat unit polymerase [Silvibacterium bohemicum]|uniref:Oligosaccharide repeat unit polymerase n=2 Tax=Silvibacterium bohemicum TaxID=1577686 RepID=A0A841JWF9_9BACT|nr:oligosaccharide repeat unit polymerase [Silvibacterium bohemicum]